MAAEYGEDPYIADLVAALRAPLLDSEGRGQLACEQVARWRQQAGQNEGMRRVHSLEQALEVARRSGLRQEAQDIRRELSGIRPAELGLERISAELEISSDEVDRFLRIFAQADTWQEALAALAVQGPPGGSPQKLADQVDQLMEQYPVQYLFTKALIGPDNATSIFKATNPEAHRKLELAEQRAQQARVWGPFCARVLHTIGARDDRPDHGQLSQFLTRDFVEDEVADRIARAIELFWQEQCDESAHVLVPRIEQIVREMARQVGIPVVREPRPEREVGGVETLGVLLRDLQGAFANAGWHAYLVNLLADPLGLNLRNSISHGLHGTVGVIDAALLIQAALLLALMSSRPLDDPPEPPAGAAPL